MIPPRRFIFLRHGETDWNREGRFQGHFDIPLNARGLAQAEEAARCLARHRIDRIVASPLIRALKTAAIVAESLGLPVHIESGLRERSFGAFDGLIVNEVKRQHGLTPDQPIKSLLPADAEQWPETVARSGRIAAKWLAACPDGAILFVAHDGIFRGLAEIVGAPDFPGRHATPYAFEPSGYEWKISELASPTTA